MVVWHVCSINKLLRYLDTGAILPPVRAWRDFDQAARMSLSTGRPVILRLKFPDDAPLLDGHFGKANVLNCRYNLPNDFRTIRALKTFRFGKRKPHSSSTGQPQTVIGS